MKISDRLYGDFEITEQVLIDLINSRPLQRLKQVQQFGMPDEYYHLKGFSRYEHSVGVMLILRKLGTSIEEQIAGLLHDVSHTAFSHVVDWVVGTPETEEHQDNTLLSIIEKSEIPDILQKYCFDFRKVSDNKTYSLLEQPAPKICADRFDYALREFLRFVNFEDVKSMIADITSFNEEMVFQNSLIAKLFADSYACCQKEHWAGDHGKARYHILSKVLKKAIEKKIIVFDDLWKTDNEVIEMLLGSKDSEIVADLGLLKKGFSIQKKQSKNSIILRKKFRYVDPGVLINGKIQRLSDVSDYYKLSLEKQKEDSLIVEPIIIIPK